MFWIFGREAGGILAPPLGIEPMPPALAGELLITGPHRMSLHYFLYSNLDIMFRSNRLGWCGDI